MLQVVIIFFRLGREKQFLAKPVNPPAALYSCVFGYGLTEALGEIGLAVRPVKDSFEQFVPGLFVPPQQPLRQRRSFSLGEVIQFNPLPDVERRRAGIGDQIRRRGCAQQTKRQPFQFRLRRPAVVQPAYRGEKLISVEGQDAHHVNLVHEDDQAARAAGQNHLSDRVRPALQRSQERMIKPECFKLIFDSELLPDPEKNAEIPLLDAEAPSGSLQSGRRHTYAAFGQPRGYARFQRGFADLAGIEHVAEFSLQQTFIKSIVGLAHDVRRSVARHIPADDVETLLAHSRLLRLGEIGSIIRAPLPIAGALAGANGRAQTCFQIVMRERREKPPHGDEILLICRRTGREMTFAEILADLAALRALAGEREKRSIRRQGQCDE
jgi:hypothetical protein